MPFPYLSIALIIFFEMAENHIKKKLQWRGRVHSSKFIFTEGIKHGNLSPPRRGKTAAAKKHELTLYPKSSSNETSSVVFLLRGLKLRIFIYYIKVQAHNLCSILSPSARGRCHVYFLGGIRSDIFVTCILIQSMVASRTLWNAPELILSKMSDQNGRSSVRFGGGLVGANWVLKI